MVAAPGIKTLLTHIFIAGDAYLDSDVFFEVKDSLVRTLAHHPPSSHVEQAFAHLNYDVALAPAEYDTVR